MTEKCFGALLFAFLLAMGVGAVFFGSDELLAAEKRYPAGPPALSAQSGVTSEAAEAWLSDRLPARMLLTGLDSARRRLSGLTPGEAVQWENGALSEAPLAMDAPRLARNLGSLSAFSARTGREILLVTPPTAGWVRARAGGSLLPYRDEALLSALSGGQGVRRLALEGVLTGDDYYRTDPHWNAEGAYAAYRAVCEALGWTPLERADFTVTAWEGFRGSCYNRSGLWLFPAETLALWDAGTEVTVTVDGTETRQSVFFTEHLGTADPYSVYLNGNHGLTVIENRGLPDGPRALMLKDSYGNSLAPLLVPHCREIVMVDLRAYRGKVYDLGDFDAALAVYCLDSLNSGTFFALLK